MIGLAFAVVVTVPQSSAWADDAQSEALAYETCMLDNECRGGWGSTCAPATFSNPWLYWSGLLRQQLTILRACPDGWPVCQEDLRDALTGNHNISNLVALVSEWEKRTWAIDAGPSKCGLAPASNPTTIEQVRFFCWDPAGGDVKRCVEQVEEAIATTDNYYSVSPCVWRFEFEQGAATAKRAREAVCKAEQQRRRLRNAERQAQQESARRSHEAAVRAQKQRSAAEQADLSSRQSQLDRARAEIQRRAAVDREIEQTLRETTQNILDQWKLNSEIEAARERAEAAERRREREEAAEEERERQRLRQSEFDRYWEVRSRMDPGVLVVTSSPPGASVTIEIAHPSGGMSGHVVPLDKTDLTPLRLRLNPARYNIVLELDGFKQRTEMISVASNEQYIVKAKLTIKPPELTIRGWGGFTYTKGRRVSIDGVVEAAEAVYVDEEGEDVQRFIIPEGSHTARIEQLGCSRTILIEAVAGGRVRIEPDCEPTFSYLLEHRIAPVTGLRRQPSVSLRGGIGGQGLFAEFGLGNWSLALGDGGERQSPSGELADQRRLGLRWAPRVYSRPISHTSILELRIGLGVSLMMNANIDDDVKWNVPDMSASVGVRRRLGLRSAVGLALAVSSDAGVLALADADETPTTTSVALALELSWGRFGALGSRPARRPADQAEVEYPKLPPAVAALRMRALARQQEGVAPPVAP